MKGLLGRLARLASALANEHDSTRSGTLEASGGRIDYGVTLDSISSGRPPRRRQRERGRHRQKYLTDVRRDGDDIVVAVDLPDVAPDDLSVSYEPTTGTVEIRDAGEPVKRLGLGSDDTRVESASFNNRVLELRLGGDGVDGE